jgi:hypothetical protein
LRCHTTAALHDYTDSQLPIKDFRERNLAIKGDTFLAVNYIIILAISINGAQDGSRAESIALSPNHPPAPGFQMFLRKNTNLSQIAVDLQFIPWGSYLPLPLAVEWKGKPSAKTLRKLDLPRLKKHDPFQDFAELITRKLLQKDQYARFHIQGFDTPSPCFFLRSCDSRQAGVSSSGRVAEPQRMVGGAVRRNSGFTGANGA